MNRAKIKAYCAVCCAQRWYIGSVSNPVTVTAACTVCGRTSINVYFDQPIFMEGVNPSLQLKGGSDV